MRPAKIAKTPRTIVNPTKNIAMFLLLQAGKPLIRFTEACGAIGADLFGLGVFPVVAIAAPAALMHRHLASACLMASRVTAAERHPIVPTLAADIDKISWHVPASFNMFHLAGNRQSDRRASTACAALHRLAIEPRDRRLSAAPSAA